MILYALITGYIRCTTKPEHILGRNPKTSIFMVILTEIYLN